MDEIVTEPSLYAEASLIDACLVLGGHFNHLPLRNGLKFQLTAATTEGAGRLDAVQLPSPSFDGAEILR